MENKHKVIFFLSTHPNIRAGGPSGYIANLMDGFSALGVQIFLIAPGISKVRNVPKWLTFWCFPKKLRKRVQMWIRFLIFGSDVALDGGLDYSAKKALINPDLKWIFTESVVDFEKIRKFVKSRNLQTKIVLMSHTPERPLDEFKSGWKIYSKKQYEMLCKRMEQIEVNAFRNADLLLFPSKEAMEPYFETWSGFSDVIKGRRLCFLQTGCAPLRMVEFDYKQVVKKFSLLPEASLRICFIGRHQEVKGYDLLVDAAKKVWKELPNAEFIIGGKISDIMPPDDKRWKECGFVNPAELLSVADVFVLPNRRTYFDLVLLEVLSSGTPVIATRTGGNKSVEQTIASDGGRIILSEPTSESIAERIIEFARFSKEEKKLMGDKLVASYEKNYTQEAFARRYLNLFEELCEEQGAESYGKN